MKHKPTAKLKIDNSKDFSYVCLSMSGKVQWGSVWYRCHVQDMPAVQKARYPLLRHQREPFLILIGQRHLCLPCH